MIKYVVKRDGKMEMFDITKIINAVNKACNDGMIEFENEETFMHLLVDYQMKNEEESVTVESIQDTVIDLLGKVGAEEILGQYKSFRESRTKVRETKSSIMQTIRELGRETDRDNGNVGNNFSAKLLRIASEANKWAMLAAMPKPMAKHHETGDFHIHDLDSYNLTTNCLNLRTGWLLENGFNTGYGTLRTPQRIESAAMLSCIMLQSSQNDMFGGQAHPNFDIDLAPYVGKTREEERRLHPDDSDEKIEERTLERLAQAMQSVICNLNTMHSRAGAQVPFSSLNIGIPRGKTEREEKDAALVCEYVLKAYIAGMGNGEACIFPNIIFRLKEGVNKYPSDPYYYLFQLACESAAKRMNPTFCDLDASFNKVLYDDGILVNLMGCRTRVAENINGPSIPEGRGNIAPVTINLVKLAIRAGRGEIRRFYRLLDEMLGASERNLLHRYDTLKELKVKDLPFVAGQHIMTGSEGLEMNDSIEPILIQGTWGIGFIGLAECLTMLTGKHHGESEESRKLGFEIVQHIRNFTDELKEKHKLNFSCYASPAEGLSGRFPKIDRKKYGVIEGVTDKDYYTNSFHIPVGYNISISDKVAIEAPYHKLCNGGHITYIELDHQPSAKEIEQITVRTFDNTDGDYLAINFHIKYCKKCEANLTEKQEVCKCGSTDIQGISRITGYLALDERFGPGKKAERADRVSHTTGNLIYYSIDK